MNEFKSSDEIIAALKEISDKLSAFQEYEKKINEQCSNFDKQINAIKEQIDKQQSSIAQYEKKIAEQTDSLLSITDSVEGKVKQCSEQIESFIEKSSALIKSADAMEKYIDAMERISHSMEYMVDEAKDIQNKLMMEKMDILISRAEKLSININQQETAENQKQDEKRSGTVRTEQTQ